MKTLFASAAAAAFLFAGSAFAGSVTVHYHDSDLASDQAAASFYQTLDRASRKACWSNEAMTMEVKRSKDSCRAVALNQAVADVDHDRLWAQHLQSRDTQVLISEAERDAPRQYARLRLVKQPG